MASYDKIIETEKNEGNDAFEDPNNSVTEKTNEIFYKEFKTYIENSKLLTEREKEVIKLRYGFYGRQYTLQEIGQLYGLTRERVRQIEVKIIEKLQNDKNIQQFDQTTTLKLKK